MKSCFVLSVSDVDVSNDEFFAIQDKAIEEHVQRLHRKLDEIEGLVSSSFIFNRLYNQNTF